MPATQNKLSVFESSWQKILLTLGRIITRFGLRIKKIVWDWVKTRIGRYPVIVVVIEIIIVKGVTLPEEAKTEFDIVEEALMT
jgi:hypothetical protein